MYESPLKKMAVLFVGHGSPMNAIEHNALTEALSRVSARLPRPKAVCVVSAHWVTSGARVMASEHPRTIHDFSDFPSLYMKCSIGRRGLRSRLRRWRAIRRFCPTRKWGLDHGSWSVLRHVYPKADVPAFQWSLDSRRSFQEHLALGREIISLRERGVLILGSGNIVHNLRRVDWDDPHGAHDWAVEFDGRVKNDGGTLFAAALLHGGDG